MLHMHAFKLSCGLGWTIKRSERSMLQDPRCLLSRPYTGSLEASLHIVICLPCLEGVESYFTFK